MFWTSSKSTETQKVQERFERKLYVRPKDRKTLLAFGNFLYEQKQYATLRTSSTSPWLLAMMGGNYIYAWEERG